ncbi:hypothetical protein IU447_11500 [Nocardia farcinica]|uniref:hypothetical protein n=1 Tax=Nocardia farcinica TaxID=37329 RepID=UPI001895DF62|nr:hypothetical protein [Nocardia farcinica]MBF6360743.1 hypothetical protein [Nocardia farcinica]
MRSTVYVDESKGPPFLLVGAIVSPGARLPAERALRALLMKGQWRIHMGKESPRRRRSIVTALLKLGISCEVFVCRARSEIDSRSRCLRRLAERAAEIGASVLVIERDEAAVTRDRADLTASLEGTVVRYLHLRPHEDPFLWIADIVAWCWQRGGSWRRQIAAMVTSVFSVD